MSLCSHACLKSHEYRIFGYPFESIGILFFILLVGLHLLSRNFSSAGLAAGWLLAAGLGAELIFIYTQKYKIGAWCPICLSIAAALLIASAAYFYEFYQKMKLSLERWERNGIMDFICRGCASMIFFSLGFLFAFLGISKQSSLQAAENDVKENIVFGPRSSPLEVYIFTDWRCVACRNLEPVFESATKKLMDRARVTFVDYAVHPTSLNFTPYNLSFMVNNKPHYFALRRALGDLGAATLTPTEQQVVALASRAGVQYKQLNYEDVALGIRYFNHLVKQLHVNGTPAVVILNQSTKKMRKLEGEEDISEAKILDSINRVR
jgi:hypothetical protein